MAASNSSSLLLIILPLTTILLASSLHCCAADTNSPWGSICPGPRPNQSTPAWKANLKSIFTSLAENVNRSDGYYRAEVGEAPDKAFALIQCRGDVSPSRCGDCTRHSFILAGESCSGSKTGVILQKWCFLRYSNASFYGKWERSGAFGSRVSLADTTSLNDDPKVDDEGMKMMSRLAADAPNENLMFATSATKDGKRYGLAQCSRDLGKVGCGDCLDYLLKSYLPSVENNTLWYMWCMGCFLMYDDHQFYFNSSAGPGVERPSTITGNIADRTLGGWFVVVMIISTTVMAYL